MTVDLSTALSGVAAANERLRASASNVASLADTNLKRTRVSMSTEQGGGVRTDTVQTNQEVQPANDVVEQQSATYSYIASLRVLQSQMRAEASVLDIKA